MSFNNKQIPIILIHENLNNGRNFILPPVVFHGTGCC